jgi:hypothetical protein
MEIRDRIASYAYAYHGDWNQIAEAFKKRLDPGTRVIPENYITCFDRAYPDQLRSLRYPP